MLKPWRRWIGATALMAGLLLPALTALAAPAGWSVSFDPRKRVFLSYSATKDGPRALLFACLRDVDTLTIASEGVPNASSNGQKATLTFTNAGARYAVDGEVSRDPISNALSFSVDIDLDAKTIKGLRQELLPALEGKGPIELAIGRAHRELPVAGLAAPLKRFKSTCFGMH
jgi:hypothetical protein